MSTTKVLESHEAGPAAAAPAAGRRSVPPVGSTLAAAVCAAAAILLPPHVLAADAAPTLALFPRVLAGMWLLKAMLLVHAGIFALLPRLRLVGGSGEPLVARASAPAPTSAEAAMATPWPSARWSAALLGLILLLATVLRLRDLGDGLWFDEIQTLVDYVRLPLGRLLTTYDSQNQHMLYTILARASVASFGEGAWALRLPAALLGVAGIGALYAFGRMVASRREALLAALILAVSYQDVWFSQNARGYTGLLLGSLVSSALFLSLLRQGRPRGWRPAALYALAMSLTLLVHVTAAFVAAAHALVWAGTVVVRRRRLSDPAVWMPCAALALAGTAALLLYAPILPQFRGTLGGETMAGVATAWKQPGWMVTELLRGLARGIPGGLLTVGLGAAVFAAGVWSFARRGMAATALMLLPALVTAAAILAMRHNLWPRFFFAYAGFGVLIVVRGVFELATRASARHGATLATAVLLLGAAGSAWTVRNAWHPKQDYAGALAYVRDHAAPGDALVAADMSNYVLTRYLGAAPIQVTDAAGVQTVRGAHPRSWIIYTFPNRLAAVKPQLWAAIQQEYHTVAELRGTLGGGSVFVGVSR